MKSFPSLLIIGLFAACALHSISAETTDPSADKPTAQSSPVWPNGTSCAVSLTYDDAIPIHHQSVAPLLDKHNLLATFYLYIRGLESPDAWKAIAKKGHELGNHSVFHPCRRSEGHAAWLPEYYNLEEYSIGRFSDELIVANVVLDILDGGKSRSFGNNCTNLTIGTGENEEPMDPTLDELFVAARGTITNLPVDPTKPEFMRLGHYSGDSKTFVQMRAEIEAAREHGRWIIYMFHGVGKGTHSMFVDDEEHRKLIEWLDEERSTIWTAPVADVAIHLKAAQENGAAAPRITSSKRPNASPKPASTTLHNLGTQRPTEVAGNAKRRGRSESASKALSTQPPLPPPTDRAAHLRYSNGK